MSLEKEFISYEQAVALKQLGFDEECMGYYSGDTNSLLIRPAMARINRPDNVVTAPLKQQVFRWLSLQLNDKDIMIPVDYDAQNKLIDVLIEKLKTKHLLF